MNFEPQKFFIGLVDFFAIIMPGAVLAYLLKNGAPALTGPWQLDTFERAAVFLFASYLLGHLISLLGSPLDEKIYQPLRDCTDFGQTRHLAKEVRGKNANKEATLAWPFFRRLAKSKWLFDENADEALKPVVRLKVASLDRLSASGAVNAFQWSKIRLGKEHPGALLEVNQFEASSKFFRSFTVVLAILAVFYAIRGCGCYALICLVLLFPALWRYIDQRFKSTQQAYWAVLTIDAASATGPTRAASKAGPTHAGGVVTRNNNGAPEFLLITASHDDKQWVLPKGHIEAEENSRFAAIREVREETGCWVRIRKYLGCSTFNDGSSEAVVRWYLMELLEESDTWSEESRKRDWLPLENAEKKATFAETKQLLRDAAELMGGYSKG